MPSSPRKIDSARANGALSRGPVTAAGKEISSHNALAHGLTARTVVLSRESTDEYDAQLNAYLDAFQPQSPAETDLVHQLAAAHWRIVRYTRIETGLFEDEIESLQNRREGYDNLPEHHRLALAFRRLTDMQTPLSLLNRYQSRLQHEYQRALKTLLQLQKDRPQQAKFPNEPNPTNEHLAAPPAPSPQSPTSSRAGDTCETKYGQSGISTGVEGLPQDFHATFASIEYG